MGNLQKRVIPLPYLDILVLLDVSPLDPEDTGLRVKVDGLDLHRERGAHLVTARTARRRLRLNLPTNNMKETLKMRVGPLDSLSYGPY